MSFSGMVKEELSGQISSADHCMLSELAGIFCLSGRVKQESEGCWYLTVPMENEPLRRKCFTLLEKTFNIGEDAFPPEESSHLKSGEYRALITGRDRIERVLRRTKLHILPESGTLMIDSKVKEKRHCCLKAFIRGAFLAAGSISDPEKGYHFEIVCQDRERADYLKEAMKAFGVSPRIVTRKKTEVVYVKEGSAISDLLVVMEAAGSMMNFENIRILKEMRNSVNRKVNCEAANIRKTVSAAVKQVEDIRLIEKRIGFESLGKGLSEMARLRIQYPDATLVELGMMSDPQVGKSGVNHRLRKLCAIAEDLRRNEEELL